jgi:hypothetical protein
VGETSAIRFEGWIPDDALGDVYVPERLAGSGASPDGRLSGPTTVTTPAGDVLATTPNVALDVESAAGAPPGFQAIRLRRETIELRGLVPSNRYEKTAPRAFGSGRAVGSRHRPSHTDAQHAILHAGAGIVDDHGDKVGIALVDTQVLTSYEPIASDDRLRTIEVWLDPFGFVVGRVRSNDLRAEGP